MPRAQDGQHGGKSLQCVKRRRQRPVHRLRNIGGQRGQDALACALAQRHRFDRCLHHVLGPAKSKCQERGARRRLAVVGGQSKGQRVARVHGSQRGYVGLEITTVHLVVTQPFQQRAAHLLGLRAQLGALAGLQDPGVEAGNFGVAAAPPSSQCQRYHRQVRARQGDV